MLPVSAIQNQTNHSGGNPVTFGYIFQSQRATINPHALSPNPGAKHADFLDLLIAELAHAVDSPSIAMPTKNPQGIFLVLGLCNILQVGEKIIRWIAVFMVDLMSARTWANKREHYESMDQSGLSAVDAHFTVSLFIRTPCHEAASPNASDSTFVADFILGVSRYFAPLFHRSILIEIRGCLNA